MVSKYCCPMCGEQIIEIDGVWGCATNDLYTCWEGKSPVSSTVFFEKKISEIEHEIQSHKRKLVQLKSELEQAHKLA